jgi:hypothetical protein
MKVIREVVARGVSAASNFGMTIITLGSYHSVLPCWRTPTDALSMWHRRRAGSGATSVLIVAHPSSRVGYEAL